MNVENYLDSTYLKTPLQSGLSEEETLKKVFELTDEAIENHLFAVMIRPDYVKQVKTYLLEKKANVKVGTVIGFHEGTYATEEKLAQAQKAIDDGADELDFVINFESYISGKTDLVCDEFVKCTRLALENQKIAKWIIEIAALTDEQIANITADIWSWSQANFSEEHYAHIFVKSSTGFYKTENGNPNGATPEGIKIMKAHSGKLPIKAAGGVRTPEEAREMIALGVTRIGTSSALALLGNGEAKEGY